MDYDRKASCEDFTLGAPSFVRLRRTVALSGSGGQGLRQAQEDSGVVRLGRTVASSGSGGQWLCQAQGDRGVVLFVKKNGGHF